MASTKSQLFDLHIRANLLSNRARTFSTILSSALLLSLVCLLSAPGRGQALNSRLNVSRRRIVLVRPPDVAKQFPNRKTAIVFYPAISGGDPRVLQKVRDLLRIKNIFDYSLEDYRKDAWLSEFDYRINHNGNYIFDVTFTQTGMAAYPDTQTKHIAIDLKRGSIIKAVDVFEPDSFKALAAVVNQKLQAELKQIATKIKSASDLEPAERDSLLEAFDNLVFEAANLDDFSINPRGVTFLYDAGFPHAHAAFEPQGQYFIPYAELKPYMKSDSLLAQFVR